MKKTVLILLILFVSCSVFDSKDEEAYYQFRGDDFNKLLSIELNQIIKYKNVLDEEIVFETTKASDNYIEQYTVSSMTAGLLRYFYYDTQYIELRAYPNFPIRYNLRRFPIDFEQAKEDDFNEYPSSFEGFFYFPFWNKIGNDIYIYINFDAEKTNMLVNGINFENVYTFNSGNPNPIVISETYIKNVNVIYYDLHYGIIGFDDLDGQEWRLSD